MQQSSSTTLTSTEEEQRRKKIAKQKHQEARSLERLKMLAASAAEEEEENSSITPASLPSLSSSSPSIQIASVVLPAEEKNKDPEKEAKHQAQLTLFLNSSDVKTLTDSRKKKITHTATNIIQALLGQEPTDYDDSNENALQEIILKGVQTKEQDSDTDSADEQLNFTDSDSDTEKKEPKKKVKAHMDSDTDTETETKLLHARNPIDEQMQEIYQLILQEKIPPRSFKQIALGSILGGGTFATLMVASPIGCVVALSAIATLCGSQIGKRCCKKQRMSNYTPGLFPHAPALQTFYNYVHPEDEKERLAKDMAKLGKPIGSPELHNDHPQLQS